MANSSRYYTLYRALAQRCPSNFEGSFGVIDENSEMSYGMNIKGGSPTDRALTTGEYLQRRALVKFDVNGGRIGKAGIESGYKFCDEVVSQLERTFNYEYIDPDYGDKLIIISIDVLSDVNDLGVNHFNIPIYSMNFGVNYKEVR